MKLAEVFTNIQDAKKFIEENKIKDYRLIILRPDRYGVEPFEHPDTVCLNDIDDFYEIFTRFGVIEIIVRWDEDA